MASRSVIVTGGFGALGRVVAAAFTDQGHKVTRVDFTSAAPDDNPTGLDLGNVDLTKADAAAGVVDKVTKKFGSIDTLINIAGGFTWETLGDGSTETWQRLYAMNVVTNATMTKAALDALKNSTQARIVNIGAIGGLHAVTGMGGYAASKSGVHRLTETMADELSGHDITVNAVLPSVIDTPANRADMPDEDFSQWVTPQALANVILFLASPEASAISGALIPVSRGS